MLFCALRNVSVAGAVLGTVLLAGALPAWAQDVLLFENFEDDMLAPNLEINMGTIAGGIASFVDDSADTRARVTVVQEFTAPVMTFSYDVKAPVTETPPAQFEMLIRAGIGTTHQTLQNAEWIFEVISYRSAADPTRFDYQNNGNESIFVVANNQDASLMFDSPIDGASVSLNPFQYISYVRNNETNTFGVMKPVSDFMDRNGAEAGFGGITRFGIGTSSSGHQGTMALDNVRVVAGVSFTGVVQPPLIPGDTDGDGTGGEFPDDFEPIRANFRKPVASRSLGDLVRDNVVNFKDFREWKAVFLGQGGSLEGVDLGFLANVPEPASMTLVVVAAAGALAISRRARSPRHGA